MRRIVITLAGVLAVLTAFTIIIHIPAIQRRVGACPFGYDKPRVAATARTYDGPLAPARPALGFTLSGTTRDDVLAWALQNKIRCERRYGDHSLECFDVPRSLLSDHGVLLPTTTVWFELDERGTVSTIKTVRRADTSTAVAGAFTATESALRDRIGSPTAQRGSADPTELSLGAFRQATVEHVYANYRAQIRATNMGNGYILTESYAAL